jgi:SAM-dependent methyltransferase
MAAWLEPFGLRPPDAPAAAHQLTASVESFGFQWSWNTRMRSEADLEWRVARRFGVSADFFAARVALDAGSGAGNQSEWLLQRGAEVVSLDLSGAIDVVARNLRAYPGWVGVQGDLTSLPLGDEVFDVVYCEGVIQHTRDSALAVRELCRVVKVEGSVHATHYARPARLAGRAKFVLTESVRRRLSALDRFTLLWVTGNLAALAHVPLLGAAFAKSGLAIRYALMPDFKTTWTNTYDYYGGHAFQRYISPEDFRGYFDRLGTMSAVFAEGTLLHARRHAPGRAPLGAAAIGSGAGVS